MADLTRTLFPGAALDHITGAPHQRVLTLGGSPMLPAALVDAAHQVFVVDVNRAAALRSPLAAVPVAARAEALPFDPCQFDVVCAHQMLHRFERPEVLSQVARVLRPGGHFAVSYLQRDDSVPWVRRLSALVHTVDPNAMRGQVGAESVDDMLTSKYFPGNDRKAFRVWVPATVRSLVQQVGTVWGVQKLPDAARERFLRSVHDLLADSTGGLDSLRLPYEFTVWRGFVDHEELTAPIQVRNDALVIEL